MTSARCINGHEMDLRWAFCPVCGGKAAGRESITPPSAEAGAQSPGNPSTDSQDAKIELSFADGATADPSVGEDAVQRIEGRGLLEPDEPQNTGSHSARISIGGVENDPAPATSKGLEDSSGDALVPEWTRDQDPLDVPLEIEPGTDAGVQPVGEMADYGLLSEPIGEGAPPSPPETPGPRRRKLFAVGISAAVLVGLGLVGVKLFGADTDADYLKALRAGGLGGKFSSDAEAVAHGTQVCSALKNGGKARGLPVDLVAVRYYCPEFKQGFHVLETITVRGKLTLVDLRSSSLYSNISSYGSTCEGSGGYTDIGSGAEVEVTNADGKILDTATLSSGSGGSYACSFEFTFRVTEGEDRYGVSIGHRGVQYYTFSQLKTDGVSLSLGL